MADDTPCPRCGKLTTVRGTFSTRGRFGFRPKELRLLSFSFQFPEVSLQTPPAACTSCGLVWADLDPAKLRQKLHDLGTADVRERLSLTDGPAVG